MVMYLDDLEAARRNRERVATLQEKERREARKKEQQDGRRKGNSVHQSVVVCLDSVVNTDPITVTELTEVPEVTTAPEDVNPTKVTSQVEYEPSYRRDRPYKRGRYRKTAGKIVRVVSLYKSGSSMRQVAGSVGISVGTVKSILHEQSEGTFGRSFSGKLSNDNTWRREKTVIRALKGLAGSMKAHGDRPVEEMVDRTVAILHKYLESDPKQTVLALVGAESCTVDDLIKEAVGVVMLQTLRLSDDFVEIDEGTFKYVPSSATSG